MKTFFNFFKGKNATNVASVAKVNDGHSVFPNKFSTVVDEDLFVENKAPENEDSEQNKANSESLLLQFLDQDFFNSGYQDGYHYHSQEMIANRIKQIKAEFRNVIDKVIENKRTKLTEFRCQGLDVEEVSDRLRKKIQLHIDSISASLDRLEKEKELSVSEEGLIMSPLHQFRNGFIRGLELYHEEKIIGDCTGLFND